VGGPGRSRFVTASQVTRVHTFAPPSFHDSPFHVFAASSSVFDSYGFEGSPGVVQKVQVFFPVSASSATTPPRTSYSMPAQPVNTFPSPTFGASAIPVCSASHTTVSHACFPDAASIATIRQSPVPTYTLPCHTATPRFFRPSYELRHGPLIRMWGSKVQRSFPVTASMANTLSNGRPR